MTPYIYLFIRRDLSIPQQIVQTAHAAEAVAKKLDKDHPTCTMVLFEVKNLSDLLTASFYLDDRTVEHELFFEPDINEHTAIATIPVYGDCREKFKQFKLKR